MPVCVFFSYSLHGVLAKIVLRSCTTRNGVICIKSSRFEHFDGPTLLLEMASGTVSYNGFG